MGRVGTITHRERHDGGFNIIHIKDAVDNEFATREGNVFVIGKEKPWISLPKGKGVKVSFVLDLVKAYTNTYYSSLLPKSVIVDELQLQLDGNCNCIDEHTEKGCDLSGRLRICCIRHRRSKAESNRSIQVPIDIYPRPEDDIDMLVLKLMLMKRQMW